MADAADLCVQRAGERAGLAVLQEAFADRRYRDDGSLVPRSDSGAVIHDVDDAVAQALAIARGDRVATLSGGALALHADTICVHGDREDAGAFARQLYAALGAAGIVIAAPMPGRAT